MTDLEGAVERFTLDLIEIEEHINAERVRLVQHSDDDWSVRYLGDLAKDGRTILNALASITRERDAIREGLKVAQAYALPTLNGIIESNINSEIMATAQADKDLIAALVNGEGGE